MFRRGISKVLIVIFVAVAFVAVAAVIFVPTLCGCGDARYAKDLMQVREMGGALTLYHKKYGHYPALCSMEPGAMPASLKIARLNGGKPACLALKLLLAEGFQPEVRQFFTPLEEAPSARTLAAIGKTPDPRKDATWACSYAYDPGHNANQGAVIFFGNSLQTANGSQYRTAHGISCEMVAKEIDQNEQGQYVINNHAVDGKVEIKDNLYADDEATLGWRDSFLQWDVPGNLP